MTTVPDPTTRSAPPTAAVRRARLLRHGHAHRAGPAARRPAGRPAAARPARHRRAARRAQGDGRPARGLRDPAGHHARGAAARGGRRLDRRRQVHAGQLAGRPEGHPARAAPPDHPLAGARAPPRRRLVVRRRTGCCPTSSGSTHATNDPAALQLVPSDAVPPGLAILDAPDVDSVSRSATGSSPPSCSPRPTCGSSSPRRRATPTRCPWEFLRQAAERSTAVAIVLDRTPEEAVQTVSTHLARMLASRGLKDSPLFVVREGPVERRRAAAGRPRRRDPRPGSSRWPRTPAPASGRASRPSTARSAPSPGARYPVADAAADQVRDRRAAAPGRDRGVRRRRRRRARRRPPTAPCCAARCWPAGRSSSAPASCSRAWRPGSAGSVTALVNTVKGKPQQAERVTVAVESGLELLILEHAEAAAERAEASWRQLAAGPGAARGRRRRARPGLP